MQSLRVMGWVSILIALAILGMGGAPIAEYFGLGIVVTLLKWVSYVSVGLLVLAALGIGGLGIYHGIQTVLGLEVARMTARPKERPLAGATLTDEP